MSQVNMTDKKIQSYWIDNHILGLNCIMKSDGSVVLLDFYSIIGSENKKEYFLKPICETTIEGIEKFNEDPWCEIEIHPNSIQVNNNLFICGEGGMGNEGFVALVSKENHLEWAMFCTESNPFVKIEIQDNFIKAYSTLDFIFWINIENPQNILITKI